ncbi:MAG: protein kinase [Myxococcota bacterium]|nr:protein kinase [Myxococcota bacterium]
MIRVGSTIGNYTIIGKLGEGAMASVYLAEHPRIGKRVAVKVIHPELSTSQEMVSRFFTEARAASQIHHECIVDIQDFGQTPDGDNFIIMEYLEGDTLASRLRTEGRFEIQRAIHIALHLCDGLAAAHAGGVIHRDLKPENIFLVRRGDNPEFPKILDFGLAKMTSMPMEGGANHKTRTGSVLGTPHYMAPEQCEGRTTVDARADIYSLGCILFQMVTGELPFPGEGFGEVLVKHLREPPPMPRSKNPQISPALEKIILHCLAKKREWRFATVLEVGRALRNPEQFSAEIGDDLRYILGPMPGEPDPGPPPPMQVPVAQMETIVAGGSMPLPPPPAPASGPWATPDQRTMFAEAPPPLTALPSPPGPLSQLETMITGGGALPAAPHAGGTVVVDPYPLRGMPPDMPRAAAPSSGRWALGGRPFLRSPVFFGLVAGVGLALLGLIGVPLLHNRVYTITVHSDPPGAQVLRDGQMVGQTPLVMQLKRGEPDVRLVLHKDGFVDSLRQIKAQGDQSLTVRLLPKPPQEEPTAEQTPQAPPAAATQPAPAHAREASGQTERDRPEAPRPDKRPRRPRNTVVVPF